MAASISSDIGYYASCSECDWTSDITTYIEAAADADSHDHVFHNPDDI